MIRSFEWLRDHGAAPIASRIESVYYSLKAPASGGPGLRRLPLSSRTALVATTHPPDLAPAIRPALPGEGVWVTSQTWSGGSSPVQTTELRSDPSYPRTVAGIAWIDAARTTIALYPGRLEPSASMPRGAMEVPPLLRPRLLATFNSAFKLQDSGAGSPWAGKPTRR